MASALSVLIASSASAQTYYSYYKDQKRYFDVSLKKSLVTIKGGQAARFKASVPEISKLDHLLGDTLFLAEWNGVASKAALQSLSGNVEKQHSVKVSPVLTNDKGKEFGGLTNQFIVKLKPETKVAELAALVKKTGTSIAKHYEYDPLTYFIACRNSPERNALTLANEFYESGLFEFAEPDFLLFVTKTTADPYYIGQWALQNTGQSGGQVDNDIDAPEAWALTTGCSSVRVAIIDDGVDLTHPDLDGNMLPGFDATGGNSGGGPDASSSHGTLCAGIVAAEANNNIGLAGVAYNAKIVPVRGSIAGSTPVDLTTAGWLAAAIDWAWASNRSDILSISWHIDVGQTAISNAIHRAVTQGRGGSKGCLVVVASGNEDDNVLNFPASNPEVMAVGALTYCGVRKSQTSCDGQNWGSNYGTGLDVVAPGVSLYSTDLQGSAGVNSGDYSGFDGTSAAAPVVAGVAALVLSINSNLTQLELRKLIESTTDKMSYSYTAGAGENTALTWNNEVGYGRVNAYNAVTKAIGGPISGPGLVCSTGSFTLTGTAPGTVTWSSSNPSKLSINASTGVATKVIDGEVTITASIATTCGTKTVSKIVHAGNPTLSNQYYLSNGLQYGLVESDDSYANTICFQGNPTTGNISTTVTGASSIGWAKMYSTPTNLLWSSGIGGSLSVTFKAANEQGMFRLTVTNTCGTVQKWYGFKAVNCGMFLAYPNPASDVLTIEFDRADRKEDLPKELKLIAEKSGKTVLSLDVTKTLNDPTANNSGKVQLNVAGFPRGTYYIHSIPDEKSGAQVQKHRIVLE